MTRTEVIVHAFKSYDMQNDAWTYSKCKATDAFIGRVRAIVIEDTAEVVEASLLDEFGRYKPH